MFQNCTAHCTRKCAQTQNNAKKHTIAKCVAMSRQVQCSVQPDNCQLGALGLHTCTDKPAHKVSCAGQRPERRLYRAFLYFTNWSNMAPTGDSIILQVNNWLSQMTHDITFRPPMRCPVGQRPECLLSITL